MEVESWSANNETILDAPTLIRSYNDAYAVVTWGKALSNPLMVINSNTKFDIFPFLVLVSLIKISIAKNKIHRATSNSSIL